MGRITTDQSHQVMATLAINAVWDEIDFEQAGLQDSIIRNSKEAGRQFTVFLKNGGRFSAEKFPVWKTIKLGTSLKTADGFRKALNAGGYRIGDWANDIFGKSTFTAAPKEIEVDLVVVSVAELGFKDGAYRKDIYKRAQELGMNLCSPEVGPQLRLQYRDQPKGEWLLIGMEPISVSGGYLGVFSVGHGGDGLWLGSSCGRPDDFWAAGHRWVFLRRK